jgi:hypothetical protein
MRYASAARIPVFRMSPPLLLEVSCVLLGISQQSELTRSVPGILLRRYRLPYLKLFPQVAKPPLSIRSLGLQMASVRLPVHTYRQTSSIAYGEKRQPLWSLTVAAAYMKDSPRLHQAHVGR